METGEFEHIVTFNLAEIPDGRARLFESPDGRTKVLVCRDGERLRVYGQGVE